MKYRFNTKPYPHQRRALKFLLANGGGGLQVPMRWGKTKVAIDFANCLYLMNGRNLKVLVICPLSVVGVWHSEIDKHTAVDYVLDWHVVNYEQTYDRVNTGGRSWAAVPSKALAAFAADLVIVDESHRIGNPSSQACKEACRLGQRARWRLCMTGTMFHRKPFYVFGQAKFYDPSIFGTAFSPFKKRIAIMGGYGGHEVVRYINLKWMMKKMRKWVYIEEYVPPGTPATVNALYFALTGKNAAAYKTMEKEDVLTVGDETVISPIILSRHLRCQQIAGGWVKTATKYRRVGDDKRRVATDRIREYADGDVQKFVVGCRFIPELRDVARAADDAGYRPILFHGGCDKRQRQERIDDFRDTEDRVAFISQLATGSMGIDLSAASVMMFYSLSESYVTHSQFAARIEKYQETRTLQYDYVIAAGTRDEVTYEALKLKQDVAEFLVTHPKRVERITAKS